MQQQDYFGRVHRAAEPGATLSSGEVEELAKLMVELRDVTLSRSTYLSALSFLERFGYAVDKAALVQPDRSAN